VLTYLGGYSDGLRALFSRLPSVSPSPLDPAVLEVSIPSARVGLTSIAVTLAVMIVGSLLFPDRDRAEAASTPSA
jgi:hypothetical protein